MWRRLARRECIEDTLSTLDFHNVPQPDSSFARLIRLTRVVATLALFAVVSGTFACREAGEPSTPAGLPSVDSDAYVALDPDSEIKASEITSDASRFEAGSSGDSIGQAAADSDAYALSRE